MTNSWSLLWLVGSVAVSGSSARVRNLRWSPAACPTPIGLEPSLMPPAPGASWLRAAKCRLASGMNVNRPSKRMMAMAGSLMQAWLCGVWPAQTRHLSPSQVKSLMWCGPVSMAQWPRTGAGIPAASAFSGPGQGGQGPQGRRDRCHAEARRHRERAPARPAHLGGQVGGRRDVDRLWKSPVPTPGKGQVRA